MIFKQRYQPFKIALPVVLAAVMMLAGCTSGNSSAAATQTSTATTAAYFAVSAKYDEADLEASWNSGSAEDIVLKGDSIEVTGEGAKANDSTVTINAAGTYVISGELTNGQIIVEAGDNDIVQIVLNSVAISCENNAPITVNSADKVILTLAEGTQNAVSDSGEFLEGEDAPTAAIFSKDDLTINGEGTLTVAGQCDGGIASRDALKIVSGVINVTASSDALKGTDCVEIKAGSVTLVSGADGIESTNDTETEKGYIAIEGGTVSIEAGLDGIQAQTCVLIIGGEVTITSGGGSANSSYDSDSGDWGSWGGNSPFGQEQSSTTEESTDSAKGIKAGTDVTISGGIIQIDSSDDALHSGGSLSISGGDVTIASGDDGAHSDASLTISGGRLTITQSYEGLESASITISGGETRVTAADDGINTAGGNDESATSGRPGQNNFQNGMNSGSNPLAISGGYVYVVADGDGIDVNGAITMTGGTVLVCGPTNDANGALDFVSFDISGGMLVAAGSSGMALTPDSTSSQYSVMVTLDASQSADTLISIVLESGETLVAFAPCKQYVNVVVSSPAIARGETYTVFTGGSSAGSETDGLYTDGSYTGGTEQASMTISDIVTTYGEAGNMNGGPGGRG